MQPRKYVSRNYALAAGERKAINVVSNWLTVLAASAAFEIGIDDEDPEWITAGIAIATAGYDKVVLYNPGAENITLTVAFSRQEVRDTRLTVSGIVETREVLASVFSPAAAKVVPAGGAVTLSVASAARTRAVYKNIGSSDVALSSSGVYVGHILAPGEVFETCCTGALNAVSSGAAGLVSVLEEKIA